MEETAGRIEKWIASKVKEAGAKGAVVGMSGGLDSSVTAVLAKRALGKNVLGLVMPCDSCPGDAHRASLVAKKFGIKKENVNLTRAFELLNKTLPEADKKTVGNLKARLRMAVLYYFANNHNYLVLGTSNKSELAIGYFTKHGDSAADIEPLGDLYKTRVTELAKFLNLPKSVIEAKPSAGLWEGQTDEKELGMDYGKLDKILEAIDKGKTEVIEREGIEKVKKMIKKSEHKKRMPDVCVIS